MTRTWQSDSGHAQKRVRRPFGSGSSYRQVLVCLLATSLLNGACTTVKSSQLPPEALRSGIRSGSLVAAGDSINVVTTDGVEHAFEVSTVSREHIHGESPDGKAVVVRIDDVVALRTREIEPVRTTFASVGAAYALAAFVLIIEIFDTW